MSGKGFVTPGTLDLPAMEEQILAFWQQEQIFARCLQTRKEGERFAFYEGPPTANGMPGLHHVFGRTLKDLVCRYRSMCGRHVERRAGWDTHGLPVEIEVEKELKLKDRTAIEDYGIAHFNRACKESVLRYKEHWDRLTRRIGYWVDLESPYITFDNHYIESVWWLISRLHAKDLLYRDHRIQWYSPASGTVLSSHEVSLGYREVTDPGALVKFEDRMEAGTFYLAWTTTPWTLPANTALAVQPAASCVKIRLQDSEVKLWLAEDCLGVLDGAHEILERRPGRELVGRRYRPLYPDADAEEAHAYRICAADFVGSDEGSGIVHIAPAYGEQDHALGRDEGLPLINPVDLHGRFTTDIRALSGLWFKDADARVLETLKERGLLYRVTPYTHNYPHDWRRWTPLMNYPMDGWFVRTSQLRERMLELNQQINWHPQSIGAGRFGNWLEHNVDWSLSRRRFWGTPLPIWQSDRSSYIEVIGSVQELAAKCTLPEPLDLHRPAVDTLSWPAPDGGTMRRVPEVLDVWFDSGAMPYAQWHYPFENEADFARNFPADFIAEGLDQTRGWFYTLHALATAVMDRPAFRNVIVNGLVLDEHGEKMSKSKGNVIEPGALIAEYGADVLRWYFTANSLPWENLRFRAAGLGETRRKFFGTLENVYAFLASYANIDGYHGGEPSIPVAERTELDRWILSRMHATIDDVRTHLDRYAPHPAAHAITHLTEDLSNWYLRRSRDRFWRKGDSTADADKRAAYQTLNECLDTIAMLMAPVAPFFAEWLYRSLNQATGRHAQPSVHLCDYPTPDPRLRDVVLERRMGLARSLVSTALQLRNQAGINVRRPLARLQLVVPPAVDAADIAQVRALVLEELNVRELHIEPSSSALVRYSAKPNFKKMGPRLGAGVQALARHIAGLDADHIQRYMETDVLSVTLDGQELQLRGDDLDIRVHPQHADLHVAHTTEGIIVALDTQVSDELLASGLARESINRIQNMRKRNAFELSDRINIEYKTTGKLAAAMHQHEAWIRHETLACNLHPSAAPHGAYREKFVIDSEPLELAISPAEGDA